MGMPTAAFSLDENANTIGCDMTTALLARDFFTDGPENKGRDDPVRTLRSSHVVAR